MQLQSCLYLSFTYIILQYPSLYQCTFPLPQFTPHLSCMADSSSLSPHLLLPFITHPLTPPSPYSSFHYTRGDLVSVFLLFSLCLHVPHLGVLRSQEWVMRYKGPRTTKLLIMILLGKTQSLIWRHFLKNFRQHVWPPFFLFN